MKNIIITRHPALVTYLREIFPHLGTAEVLPHASPDDVRGNNVYGVLPLHLAAEAYTVTEICLDIPPELRGHELTLEQVKALYRGVRSYAVTKV